MKRLLLLLLVALCTWSGCRRQDGEDGARSEPAGHADEAHEHAAAEPDGHAADADIRTGDVLRIRSEMLRDLRVTTAPVESRLGGEGVAMLGEIRVNEDAYAEVGTPVGARVVRLLAGVGQQVPAGRTLAELESVELGKARAEHLTAKARADVARKALERKQSLAAERIVPEREVQEAQARASAAEASLRAAQAGLRALGIDESAAREDQNPSRFELRSAVAGTILERNAVVGKFVDPATPLFKVADLSRLWLTVQAFERDAVQVRTGSPARVSLPALPGKTFSGAVTLVGRHVKASSRTVEVRIDLANDDGALRPGMSATAWVPLGGESDRILSVPAVALQRVRQGWVVFVPRQEGVFEVRQVGRGRDLAGEVEIVSGLEPGEKVVVEGAFLLKAEGERAAGEGEHHEH